jgi:hypothetical protein
LPLRSHVAGTASRLKWCWTRSGFQGTARLGLGPAGVGGHYGALKVAPLDLSSGRAAWHGAEHSAVPQG